MRATLRNLSFRALRVWQRDADVYFTTWKTEFLPPLLEPILYVLAFGLGLGQLIRHVEYVDRKSVVLGKSVDLGGRRIKIGRAHV